MHIVLSPETEKLIEDRMKQAGFSSADDLVRVALKSLDQVQAEDFDDLDPETRAAIDEAEGQFERGEGRPWEEVREELRKRFIDKGV